MRVGYIGSGNMASAPARGWGDPVLATGNGSGRPAEAWIGAGIRHGLQPAMATTLVTETMAGAAALLRERDGARAAMDEVLR
jgi:hypothetical protein